METSKAIEYTNNATNVEMAAAINNLVNAIVANEESMSNMTSTINTLTIQLVERNAKLGQILELTTVLQTEVANLKKKKEKVPQKLTFDHYCWTYASQASHSSKECNRRAAGHQENTANSLLCFCCHALLLSHVFGFFCF